MSYFVALTTNSSERVACAVEPYRRRLLLPGGRRGGWGLGYHRDGELLRRIEPRERGEELDVGELLGELESKVLVFHSREATVGPVRRENTHPFRFQQWLWAHNGTWEGFSDIRERVLEAMPPFIRRSVRGDTDSEYLFHLVLSFLHDAGKLGCVDPGTEVIRAAMRHAFAAVEEFSREEGSAGGPASAVISDGYSLVAMQRGVPVQYSLIEGIRDCPLCRLSRPSDASAAPIDHEGLRAVLLRSGTGIGDDEGFHALEEGSMLAVTRDYKVEFRSLG
ncbi:MAG: class II glutamine amidotransferase [Polyangia bacterium]